MINFVANAFQFLFAILCLLAFAALAALFLGSMLSEPGNELLAIVVLVVGFVGVVFVLGLAATLLDIRRCVKEIVKVKRQPRLDPTS